MAGFTSEHKDTIGLLFIVAGVFGMLGSITGRLAPMIGALFLPASVKASSSNPGGTTTVNIPGQGPTQLTPFAQGPPGTPGNL